MTRNTPLLECRGYFATSISAQPASDGSDYRLVPRTPRRPLRACHHTSVAHRCNELENRPRSFAMADSWENSKLSGSSIDLTDTAAALQVYSTGIIMQFMEVHCRPYHFKAFLLFRMHSAHYIIYHFCNMLCCRCKKSLSQCDFFGIYRVEYGSSKVSDYVIKSIFVSFRELVIFLLCHNSFSLLSTCV